MIGWIHRLAGALRGSNPTGSTLSPTPSADSEVLAQALEARPDFRVLRAIKTDAGVARLRPIRPGERIAAVIDTETTGLDPSQDRIIEVAIQRLIFDGRGQIVEVERSSAWLEDPQRPLSTTITDLTGLRDGDLRGSRFDDDVIVESLREADLIIAHNAAFDRPFMDRRFPRLGNASWACSLSQLDWRSLGYDGRTLGHLLLQSGRFFDGHRAMNDTQALTTLLGTLAPDGRTILSHLLDRCEQDSIRFEAIGAPFEAKNALKARGYRWDGGRRIWSREVEVGDSVGEADWLLREVYRGRGGPRQIDVTSRTRFSGGGGG